MGKYQHRYGQPPIFLLGLSWFAYVELETYLLVWSNPNESNRRSAVQSVFSRWMLGVGPKRCLVVVVVKWSADRLLLRGSTFESSWRRQFLSEIVFEKNKNKQNEVGDVHFLNRTKIWRSLLFWATCDLPSEQIWVDLMDPKPRPISVCFFWFISTYLDLVLLSSEPRHSIVWSFSTKNKIQIKVCGADAVHSEAVASSTRGAGFESRPQQLFLTLI